jgi:maleate isomerase
MDLSGADALLLSGTGMPTLGAIKQGAKTLSIPVLSSNYCLAWALMDTIGRSVPAWRDGEAGL